ncbi:hypothetical protein [Eubacterium ramulus]
MKFRIPDMRCFPHLQVVSNKISGDILEVKYVLIRNTKEEGKY